MSELTQAMAFLQKVFDKYAGKEGEKDTLTKKELSELLRNEVPGARAMKSSDVEKFFGILDNDSDGVVNFQEYVTFVVALATMCHQK